MSWAATTVAGLSSRRREGALEANKKISALFLVGDQDEIHAALPPAVFAIIAFASSTPAKS
jgi:hypothetical protein